MLIVACRFLAHVPVPLARANKAQRGVIDSVVPARPISVVLNLHERWRTGKLSIVLVGLSPFITASIIALPSPKAIPKLEELHKDSESGRRKINQWTRLITVPLAIIQSIAVSCTSTNGARG